MRKHRDCTQISFIILTLLYQSHDGLPVYTSDGIYFQVCTGHKPFQDVLSFLHYKELISIDKGHDGTQIMRLTPKGKALMNGEAKAMMVQFI